MIKKELNLSEVVEYFKNKNISSFEENVDEFGDYFITSARIMAVILSSTPLAALSNFAAGIDAGSIRISKLFSWLPDKVKYSDKGREKMAIERYELAACVNYMLIQIAITNAVKEYLVPTLIRFFKDVKFDAKELTHHIKFCEDYDQRRKAEHIPILTYISHESLNSQCNSLLEPILNFISIHKEKKTTASTEFNWSHIYDNFIRSVNANYQAYLINLSTEFPEFALWVDFSQKENILNELKSARNYLHNQSNTQHEQIITRTEVLINQILELRKNEFNSKTSFTSFIDVYKDLFQIHKDNICDTRNSKVIENINAHHNAIKAEMDKPISDSDDDTNIFYPRVRDMYISQSYESIRYNRREHKHSFLTGETLADQCDKGEDIGTFLMKSLINPHFSNRPIIILGNPGAGKSMLSKMFSGALCETNDFIPFYVRLRDVASSSGSVSEHINRGLSNSINNSSDINWIEWAKEFKDRIPVIILDGFDELMQTSNTELNDYIKSIKDFQEKALHNNISVRVILTSRITVMHDVTIPDETQIIKLDSFDKKRIELWINNWNKYQVRSNYKFALPANDKIELLAQEPLLLFMLAIYDFGSFELQKIMDEENFNQSKLYDSLLNRFIKRQLLKNPKYCNASNTIRDKEDELFRLRLGMTALMMFLHNTTSRDSLTLYDEMKSFGLDKSFTQNDDLLGNFFFIHENKSITMGG